ncbi:hypothetical protein D3C72_1075470 [compost metagenome]
MARGLHTGHAVGCRRGVGPHPHLEEGSDVGEAVERHRGVEGGRHGQVDVRGDLDVDFVGHAGHARGEADGLPLDHEVPALLGELGVGGQERAHGAIGLLGLARVEGLAQHEAIADVGCETRLVVDQHRALVDLEAARGGAHGVLARHDPVQREAALGVGEDLLGGRRVELDDRPVDGRAGLVDELAADLAEVHDRRGQRHGAGIRCLAGGDGQRAGGGHLVEAAVDLRAVGARRQTRQADVALPIGDGGVSRAGLGGGGEARADHGPARVVADQGLQAAAVGLALGQCEGLGDDQRAACLDAEVREGAALVAGFLHHDVPGALGHVGEREAALGADLADHGRARHEHVGAFGVRAVRQRDHALNRAGAAGHERSHVHDGRLLGQGHFHDGDLLHRAALAVGVRRRDGVGRTARHGQAEATVGARSSLAVERAAVDGDVRAGHGRAGLQDRAVVALADGDDAGGGDAALDHALALGGHGRLGAGRRGRAALAGAQREHGNDRRGEETG